MFQFKYRINKSKKKTEIQDQNKLKGIDYMNCQYFKYDKIKKELKRQMSGKYISD